MKIQTWNEINKSHCDNCYYCWVCLTDATTASSLKSAHVKLWVNNLIDLYIAYRCISSLSFFFFWYTLLLFTLFYLSVYCLFPIVLLHWWAPSSPALYSVVNSWSALPLSSQTATFPLTIPVTRTHTYRSTSQRSQNFYCSSPHSLS